MAVQIYDLDQNGRRIISYHLLKPNCVGSCIFLLIVIFVVLLCFALVREYMKAAS
jgi:hypothetical protein